MPLDKSIFDHLSFGADGLIPAIIQSADSGRVLMMAWMNHESLSQSIELGETVFWSRSRQELWRKGDTSGHIQLVRSVALDCDGDTLLIGVEQVGPACHTGTTTCFDGRALHARTDVSVQEAQ